MSDEKLEQLEELIWQNDPPENEGEEPTNAAQNSAEEEAEEEGEVDPLAPTGEGDIKPTNVDPGTI